MQYNLAFISLLFTGAASALPAASSPSSVVLELQTPSPSMVPQDRRRYPTYQTHKIRLRHGQTWMSWMDIETQKATANLS